MQVRNVNDAAKKFSTRAAAAQNDYQAGVQGAGQRWQEGAAAAEDAYKAGVQEAMNEGRFGRGVRKAGAAKYQDRATKLGPQRYQQGVTVAQDEYAKNTAPYFNAMQSTNLSPRGARGSAQNARRVQEQMDLMRKTRREQLGA